MQPLKSFQRHCISVAIGQALLAPIGVQAASLVVTTTSDVIAPSGCSLREAVKAVEDGSVGTSGCIFTGSFGVNDEIDFALLSNSTITLSGGQLEITKTLAINGPGANELTIDANNQSRIFDLYEASNALIDGLTLTGGSSPTIGGAIYAGNAPGLTISNMVVTSNSANGNGGGIFLSDSDNSKIADSVISNNSADSGSGGGISLDSSESITISNSTISGNSASDDAGGIYVDEAEYISILHSTIIDNSANENGGGLLVNNLFGISISGSTIANNRARSGGGVFFGYDTTGQVVNSTISGNIATPDLGDVGGQGGGIQSYLNTGFTVFLYGVTINNNRALNATLPSPGGGIYAPMSASIDLVVNNVVANSVGGDCNMSIANNSYNWVEDNSCFTTPNPALSGNPRLGKLADNGGPTLTHLPLTGSGLIDAGYLLSCLLPPIDGVDQRGEARGPASCNIGAVEGVQEDEGNFYVVPLANGKTVIFGL